MSTTMKLLAATLLAGGMMTLAGCSGNNRKAEPASTNAAAALRGQLPHNPLAWRAITSSIDNHAGTASTLYGNDTAVTYARTTPGFTYPSGSVLALVTWAERDDPHWFGAKIPGTPQTVEFVSMDAHPAYEVYRGSPLARADVSADQAATRMDVITRQRAAVMP